MRKLSLIILLLLISCSGSLKKDINKTQNMKFKETEILEQLDLAFNGIPSKYYPPGKPDDIKYNFFLDLEHGYCETAGNRIHLYADSTRWVVVFEKSGYQNRGNSAEIQINYVGNCVNYPTEKYPDRNYITNTSNIILVDSTDLIELRTKKVKKWKHLN